jgi:hypothetical protein
MVFQPMNPLPSEDEVLEKLDPKAGEQAAYISREDVRYGWIYFMSRLYGVLAGGGGGGTVPGTPGVHTHPLTDWVVTASYEKGALAVYQGQVYRAVRPVASYGQIPSLSTTDWTPVGRSPTVVVETTAAMAPANYAFRNQPRQGDLFINKTDMLSWAFGPNGWERIQIPPVDSVFGGMLVVTPTTANQFNGNTLPPVNPLNPGKYYVAAEAVVLPANFPTVALQNVTVEPGDWLVDAGNDYVLVRMSADTQTFTSTAIPGETPTTWVFGSAPLVGDFFFNTGDDRAWVRIPNPAAPATAIWEEMTQTPNSVTVSNTAGVTPQTFATPPLTPVEGDVFINAADRLTWFRDGTTWVPLPSARLPHVTVSDTAGVLPGTYTPALTPEIQDIFVNVTDRLSWIYAEDPANAGTLIWAPLGAHISTWATDTPQRTPTTHTFPRAVTEGDVFVNVVDDLTWIYVEDPANPGAHIWHMIQHPDRAIVSVTPGETPLTARGGAPVFTPLANWNIVATAPIAGQMSVGGGSLQVSAIDNGGTDRSAVLNAVAVGNVLHVGSATDFYSLTVTGSAVNSGVYTFTGTLSISLGTGVAPAGSTPLRIGVHPPLTPDIGDVFINRPDHLAWVYADQNGAQVWEPITTPGPVITVSDTDGDEPNTFAFTATPRVGDVFHNETDEQTWIYAPDPGGAGDAWFPINSQPPESYVSNTAGETPVVWANANSPDLTDGDIFINTVDRRAWVWADDPASAGQYRWSPLPQGRAFTSSTAGQDAAAYVTANPITPIEGDLFINTADSRTWVWAVDPANAAQFLWLELASNDRVVVFTQTGESPAAPPTPLPAPSRIGDMVINAVDHFTWVFDGVTWQEIVSPTTVRGQVTYAGAGPFDPAAVVAPLWGMAVGTLPDPATLEPVPNDSYYDSTSGDMWILT